MQATTAKIRFDKSGYYFIFLLALIFAGFWNSYFSRFFTGTNDYNFYFHFHALMMGLWVITLIVQPLLIRKMKLALHRIIGKLTYVLMPVMLLSVLLLIDRLIKSTIKKSIMRKLTLLFLVAIACSCNNETASKEGTKDPTVAVSPKPAGDYPYAIDHPDNWEIGGTANTMTALKALKAWEERKMDEAVTYFADSVKIEFDGLNKKMSNDSLKAMFTRGANNYKMVKVNMKDWESVVSKDKSEEWVTLWYTQNWEMKNGTADSVAVVNDVEFKNGKIIRLAEYTRKLN